MKAFTPDGAGNNFSLESSILAELKHPRIPRYIEAFTHNGVNYLVQEFIHGYPLSYYIVNGKRFDEEEAKKILLQLLEILDYLHTPEEKRHPVIHRDLRLSNLFWNMDKVYLVDFGHARYFNEKSDEPMGNGIKMSGSHPEVEAYTLLRKEISPRSDLFGAGVVGLDLFTNWIEDETLFQHPWQDILPASDAYKTLIERLLNPEKQFASAQCAMKYFDE
jgi:serine/threonine-protein kinase